VSVLKQASVVKASWPSAGTPNNASQMDPMQLDFNDKEDNGPMRPGVAKNPVKLNGLPDSVLGPGTKKHHNNVAAKSGHPSSPSFHLDTKPHATATTTTADVEMANKTDSPSPEAVPPTP